MQDAGHAPGAEREAVEALLAARAHGRPLDVAHLPVPTLASAYRVQRRLVAAHVARGRALGGWKLGMTNRARRAALGLDGPTSGALFADAIARPGETLVLGPLVRPHVEPEIAYLVDEPLSGAVSSADVRAACRVAPALELLDSCTGPDWPPPLAAGLADNAAGLGALVGSPAGPAHAFDPAACELRFAHDDAAPAAARVAEALGDPAEAVAWLAGELASRGIVLRAGDVVLTGGVLPALPLIPGRCCAAGDGGLGGVTATIQPGEHRCELHISVT